MRPFVDLRSPRLTRVDAAAVLALLAWGLWWLLPDLWHPSIHNWDESFHQAVVRGTSKAFFAPHMYDDPLYPLNLRQWWYSGIWLHKATGVFWWGALVLKLVGTTTAALRSASLVGELGTAVLVYLMVRALAGRAVAWLSGAAFLLLPFGWILVQGHFVADVTDVAVTAFVTLGMAFLWRAVEKDSDRWAAAAGAAIGVAYLCKTFLALAPLGVAGAWWGLGRVGFCRGPRLWQVVLMFVAAVAVAAPWNLYAWRTWPDVYVRAFEHTIGFLSATSGEDVGSGARPGDAIFNEVNWIILRPFPHPFTLLAGLWLLWQTVRTRDGRLVAVSLWLWSSWVAHSLSHVKGHGHMWNCVPAVFVAYALVVRDAFRSRGLAAAVVVSLLVFELRPALGLADTLRAKLPAVLAQTRTWKDSNFVEQFLLVPPAALLAWALGRPLRYAPVTRTLLGAGLGLLAVVLVGRVGFVQGVRTYREQFQSMDHDRQWSSTQDVGLALQDALPEKAVIYLDTQLDYGVQFEYLNLLFWSGRMVYRQPPDLATAAAKGYHPYVVSPAAEPYQPVPGVPPWASLRAYDALVPAAPPPLPEGLRPLTASLGTLDVVGWSARPVNARWSRYAFYVMPKAAPQDVRVTFHLQDGTAVTQTLAQASTLRTPDRLANVPWYVLPAVGPRHEQVARIELGP